MHSSGTVSECCDIARCQKTCPRLTRFLSNSFRLSLSVIPRLYFVGLRTFTLSDSELVDTNTDRPNPANGTPRIKSLIKVFQHIRSNSKHSLQDSHPSSPSMQGSETGMASTNTHLSPRITEQSPPKAIAVAPKGPDDLRLDYGEIHASIHDTQGTLFEMRHLQAPGNVIVTTPLGIRQYLPPDTPQQCTLAEYRALLSVALRKVREQFMERESERKAALKEASHREQLKKEALEKEALKKEALEKVSTGTT